MEAPQESSDDADLRAALEKLPAPVREQLVGSLAAGVLKDRSYFADKPFKACRGRYDRFTATEREAVKDQVARLDRMGYTQVQIAGMLNTTQSSVSLYLKEVREEYRKSILDTRAEMAMRELAVLMDVRQKAYEGLLQVERDGVSRRTHKEKLTAKGHEIEDVEVDEGTLPPTEYLAIIVRTNERICDMFGLDEAVKQVINVSTTNNNVLTGAALLDTVLAASREAKQNPVRMKLAEIEAGPRHYDVPLNGHT